MATWSPCLSAGHLGLRPLEVRAAPWGALDGSTLTVGRSRTKATAARMRTISVPDATAQELREWRLRSGRPAGDQPIIGAMTENAMKCWARRTLRTAARAATGGRSDVTLYTLRHTHASACHYANFTTPEAARRLGTGAALHMETYSHVIESISGGRYTDLDALIAAARAELRVPVGSPATEERR
jgi:integrase